MENTQAKENIKGVVFNIQRYSIDDGPGVRTTVFLKGCPLTCLWCSNPESQNPRPELTWRYTSCKGCGECVKICPEKALCTEGGELRVNRELCRVCGKCADRCVNEALSISGKLMTVQEVIKVIKRDLDYYEVSGGGVTASGGEILSQAEFVTELFKNCRELGISTCADTSGFGGGESLDKLLEYTDLVLFDIKHIDPGEHLRACGQRNGLILDNLRRVVNKGVPVIIRVPLIPDYNTDEASLAALAKTVSETAAGAEVNIMPYHRYGEGKYKMLGRDYPLESLRELTQEDKERASAAFESAGLFCTVSK